MDSITSAKEVTFVLALVCLFVSRITRKVTDNFHERFTRGGTWLNLDGRSGSGRGSSNLLENSLTPGERAVRREQAEVVRVQPERLTAVEHETPEVMLVSLYAKTDGSRPKSHSILEATI